MRQACAIRVCIIYTTGTQVRVTCYANNQTVRAASRQERLIEHAINLGIPTALFELETRFIKRY